jgi:hypothetical protein
MAYTTIDNPELFFNTVLYTGDGTSSKAITGVGFQPDWVWLKARSSAYSHQLFDVVRGATKLLTSEATDAEQTLSGVTSFDSDGFTVGADAGSNNNTTTFASWNWLAGGSASSNSDGDITSTVSANTTSGFSVVSYTGNGSTNQTIGHGLGAIPDFIIVKQRNTTRNWPTYTKALGNGVAFLDIGDAWAGGSSYQNYWYTSGMTSSTFGISNNDNTNASSGTFIAYCFSAKQGYSKMGTYTGNGSADGAFLYTGFKPAFFMIKRTTSAGYNWLLYDNKRQVSFNVVDDFLYPDTNDAETTGNANQSLDFLSNGIKFRGNGASSNGSGIVYLYMAFAESPFVTSGTKAAGTAR